MSYEIGSDYLDIRDMLQHRDKLLKENLEDVEHWDEEDQDFLSGLSALEDQLWDSLDKHAENEPTLIHERHWEAYAEDFAWQVGEADPDSAIYPYIDWKAYAEALQVGYAEYEINGHTYYGREY